MRPLKKNSIGDSHRKPLVEKMAECICRKSLQDAYAGNL